MTPKKEKKAEGIWLSGGIETPKGVYVPASDDLVTEVKAAARFAGLSQFKLFLNGTQVMSPKELPVKKLSELTERARVAGIEATIAVEPYNKAG